MDDAELLRRFEDRSLPVGELTHRGHVKVAYLHLRQYPLREALDRLREAFKAFAAANGAPVDSPSAGYNETTTHALLHLIAAVMQAYGETFPVDTADAFCDAHPQLMTKHILRFFYTPGRRLDPRTIREFLEPDLAPLPKRTSA